MSHVLSISFVYQSLGGVSVVTFVRCLNLFRYCLGNSEFFSDGGLSTKILIPLKFCMVRVRTKVK